MATDTKLQNLFATISSPIWFSIVLLTYFGFVHVFFNIFFHPPEQLLWIDYSGSWLNPIWQKLDHFVAYALSVVLYICLTYSVYLFLSELSDSKIFGMIVSLVLGINPLSLSLILIQDNLPLIFGLFLVFTFYLLNLKRSSSQYIPVCFIGIFVPEVLPVCSLAVLFKRWPKLLYVSGKDKLFAFVLILVSCAYIYVLKAFVQRESLYPFWVLFNASNIQEYALTHLCELSYVIIRLFSTQSKILIESSQNQILVYTSTSLIVLCCISLMVSYLKLRKISFLIQWIVLSYILQLGLPQSWFINDRLLFLPSFGILFVIASCFETLKSFLKKKLNFQMFEYIEANIVLLVLLILFSAILTLSEFRIWSSNKDLFQFSASESEQSADAQYAIGLMSMNEGRNLQAIEAFRKALTSNIKKYKHLSNTIGQLHYAQKEYNSAVQWFLVSKRNDEHDGVAYYWLGKCYFDLGAYVDAKEHFLKSIESIDNKGDAYFELFRLSLIEDSLAAAEEYLKRSIQLNGQNLENTLWSAVLSIRQEKFKEGLYIFEKFQNEVNKSPMFLDWQMIGYGSIGSVENAKKILNYLTSTQKSADEYKNHFRQAARYYEKSAGRTSEKVKSTSN